MPALLERESSAVERSIARKLWTIDEYERLSDLGFLEGSYELIEGEIIEKMGQNRTHINLIMFLTQWLLDMFGRDHVQAQGPVVITRETGKESKPEPDLAALNAPLSHYTKRNPSAADVALLIEVSDTTRESDLGTKADMYARAGFADYWVIDVQAEQIVVHRDPTAKGYGIVTHYAANHDVSPLAKPDAKIAVAALFPADDPE